MTNAILPNGNDILLDLIGRDVIRRKITILGEFIPSAEWFARSEQARKDLLRYCAALTSQNPKGVYLDVRTDWAWFRGDPKSGMLEVSYDGRETWEPYPWPQLEETRRTSDVYNF